MLKIVSLIMLLYDGKLTKVSVLQAQFYDVILFFVHADEWEKKDEKVLKYRVDAKSENKGSEKLAYLYFCDS